MFASDAPSSEPARSAPMSFGNSGPMDPMMIDVAPSFVISEAPRQQLTGKAYLRHLLSSSFVDHDDTDEDKDAHIETVLKDININNFLRKQARAAWILPADSTLWNLLNNCQGNWAPLIAALVEVAERGIGEVDTTFPVLNSRKALEEALKQSVDSLPFVEVVIYDPKMSPSDRKAAWIQAAPTVLTQRDLCTWLDKASLANKQLSQPQMNSMLNKLMIKVEKDVDMRRKVLAAVRQKAPNWTMADFDSLIPSLFDKPAAGEEPELSFSASNGWAKTFLQKLEIVNPELEKHLEEMQDDLTMFGLTPKKKWPAQLLSWGATGTQHFKITAALANAGLIS